MAKFKLKEEEIAPEEITESIEDDDRRMKRMQIENYINFINSVP